MYKKILIPVDLNEKEMTELARDAALALAKADDEAQLRFVNVQPLVPAAFIEYVPPHFEEEMRESAEQALAEVCSGPAFPPGRFSSIVRFGAVYPEVLAEAEAWGADLVILGSHRPSMVTYLLGSSAAAIVRHAKCSVLVVRK